MIGPVDKLLNFGECSLSSQAALPDTINVGKSQTERMSVSVQCTETASGGTSIALQLEGSDDGTSFAPIGSAQTVTVAQLKAGANFALPIPEGVNKPYLKVTCAKTGSFTAGKLNAFVDTYMGI